VSNSISSQQDKLNKWLIDSAGNIAISTAGLAILGRIKAFIIPFFTSTEQAVEWGSRLNDEQHATLVDLQRTASDVALGQQDLQRMVNLATQSQLMREAVEAAPANKVRT
jgi:hypothetical protein